MLSPAACLALLLLLPPSPSAHGRSAVEAVAPGRSSAVAPRAEAPALAPQMAELEAALQSPDEMVRRTTVRRLAELDRPEAWRLVLQALSDEAAPVADEAQILIPGCDGATRERLLGREGLTAKADLVRERVAEALGRFETLAAAELGPALSDDSSEVRRLACYSFERLARGLRLAQAAGPKDRAAFEALERLASKDKDPEVRAAARVAFTFAAPRAVAVAPGTAPAAWPDASTWAWLDAGLESREPLDRAGSAVALGGLGQALALGRERDLAAGAEGAAWHTQQAEQLLGRGQRLLIDREAAVRRVAVRALAAYPSRAVLAAMIERLGVEPDALTKGALVAGLQGASGLFHRADPRPWERWLEGLPPEFFGRLGGGAAVEDDGSTSARLVGLPIPPGPVAFLIDMSGSMWNKDEQGRTMKSLVDVELARCLEALSEGSSFLLVPYATEPEPYGPRLTTATPKKIAAAADWFRASTLRGKGNLWAAVQVVRGSDPVDSIAIFSDGAPTGGPHWELGLMVELLLEQARFRGTVFHAVLTEEPKSKRLAEAWRRLCESTGGRLAQARFSER